MNIKLSLIAATLALTASAAMAQTQGVSKNELVLGSIQDLSGPLAGFGKQVRLGMMLRVDEANEQDGVGGARSSCWLKTLGMTHVVRCWRPRSWSTKTKSLP